MNSNNNIYNKNEVENKLKNFKEGSDYSISPTDEPNITTYNFHNDKLRSMFRNDKIPVRITRESYDGKDYSYRGHFEEGKDYSYSRQDWYYGENFQGKRGTDIFGNGEWNSFMDGIKWDEHYRESSPDKWKVGWVYRGKGNIYNSNLSVKEPRKIEPNHDLKWKYNQLTDKLNSLLGRPESDFGVNGKEKKECEIAEVKRDIAAIEREIENERVKVEREKDNSLGKLDWVPCSCGKTFAKNREHWMVEPKDESGRDHFCSSQCAIDKYPNDRVEYYTPTRQSDNNHSDLYKENQELRQQLTEVQKQLAEVLAELKKLKSNISGKSSEKLSQQIVQSERLLKEDKNVSVNEIKEQVNKSQALMNELNTVASTDKDNKGNGSLPYVIGGSVILAVAGIIGYLLIKKNKQK